MVRGSRTGDGAASAVRTRSEGTCHYGAVIKSETDVYAMRMLSERIQLLIDRDRRRRLEAEARRRRMSVGAVIREAIDARLAGAAPEQRVRAIAEMRAMTGGRYLPPDALDRIVEEEREGAAGVTKRPRRR